MNPRETSCMALVDAHFADAISPSAERTMRAHLADCDACRERYERHLLFEQLDPSAAPGSAERRMAVGLGLAALRRRSLPLLTALAVAAALVVGAGPSVWRHRLAFTAPEFSARGASLESAGPELLIYRIRAGRAAELVSDTIEPGDELAFAYANPLVGAFDHLLVFATDEHHHVYWYHPAWTDEDEDPRAIAIDQAPGLHELGEAVKQPLDGRTLQICAVFTRTASHVKEVERLLQESEAVQRDVARVVPGGFAVVKRVRIER